MGLALPRIARRSLGTSPLDQVRTRHDNLPDVDRMMARRMNIDAQHLVLACSNSSDEREIDRKS